MIINKLYYFVFFYYFVFYNIGYAQEINKASKKVTDLIVFKENKLKGYKDSIVISGVVKSLGDNYLLPGVKIIIKNTKTNVSSNFDGFYKLNITKEIKHLKKLTLCYSWPGYETFEKDIDLNYLSKEKNRIINIKLKQAFMFECVGFIKVPFHKRVWFWLKNIFK